jgi:hypothetical protein
MSGFFIIGSEYSAGRSVLPFVRAVGTPHERSDAGQLAPGPPEFLSISAGVEREH